ncbi:hypothetical protein MSKU9_2105 [Komagataeibacter diospyri]|uniref:Uncharacterized protein n=1 Tax=Komagataeibacter diospyri TaxID=1932662 RepID=A0A4P5NUS3_9PROT|nr:hypothetical protein MSKU9_2105 [Komagataeibacter diospyri]
MQGKPWWLPMENLLSVQRILLLFWLCWNVSRVWELNLLTRMKKQATMLVRKCMTSLRKGTSARQEMGSV